MDKRRTLGFDGFYSNRYYWPQDTNIMHPGEIQDTTPVYKMDSYMEVAGRMLESPTESVERALRISEELSDLEYLTETLRWLLTPDQLNEILTEGSAIPFLWGAVIGSTYLTSGKEDEHAEGEDI